MGVAGGDRPGLDRGRRLRDESGNIFVMFAIFVPIFIVVCAVAIDVGYWWVNAKKAQVAADACALAAAGDPGFPKPYDQDHCRFGSLGRDYVRTNLHLQSDPSRSILHKSTHVVAPYKTDPKRVEATVTIKVNTFFGTYVGVDSVEIVRRAVAEKLDGTGNWAIYSHQFPSCESGMGLEFNGENMNINGLIHSNGQFRVDAGPFWAADGTIARNNCTSSVDEDVYAQFGPDATACAGGPCREPRDLMETQNWPAWYTPAEFGWNAPAGAGGCTYKALKVEITATELKLSSPDLVQNLPNRTDGKPGRQIPSGTYCATESFKINGDNLKGSLTALAPELVIDGNNQEFTPFASPMLFFTVPNTGTSDNDGSLATGGDPDCNPDPAKETVLNGNGHKWEGVVFNPCGRVYINVGGSTIGSPALTGTIMGWKVKIDGDNFNMIGKDDFGGATELALWE
jgi:Putative Flp pilus-assembly TadE/G-like